MKVQIIYLDPHDDHVSARDKLAWAKAPRVLVVWPKHGRVLVRRLDLVLLRRFARQHSAQIGLVTHDPDVRDHAEILGLPVFDSLERVPEEGWSRRSARRPLKSRRSAKTPAARTPPSPPPPPAPHVLRLPRWGEQALVAIALASLTLLAASLLPQADVVLTPARERQEIQLTVRLDPGVEEPLPDGRIPARRMSTKVADSLRIPTSGYRSVPHLPARGEVVFTNLTSEPITVPAGTGVRASRHGDLRFETTESVQLPGEDGVQASAPVTCTVSGPDGNLSSEAIDAVEGTLGIAVSVSNPEPTSGGSNQIRSAVAYSDHAALKRELTRSLLERAREEFEDGLRQSEELVQDSLRVSQILAEEYDRQIEEPSDSVALSLELEVEAFVYRAEDLRNDAARALRASLPEGWEAIPDTLTLQVEQDSRPGEGGTLFLVLKASQAIHPSVDRAYWRQRLQAQRPERAREMLQQVLDLEVTPSIRLLPRWLPRLPWLGMHIDFYYPWELE